MDDRCELTILMPCLNEAETLQRCILKACAFVARTDSDDIYDFSRLELFVERLREGYDLVMGNRFKGGIAPGAMPALHRYLGNPVLTAIGRCFFGGPSGDFHCGLRGFRRDSVLGLDLQASGMEFASEMIVKAALRRLKIAEIATTLSPDGRSRPPHLRSWRDGWRHLRFLLLFCPRWLFLYPGALLFLTGLLGMAWLLPQPREVLGVSLDIHTLVYCSLATVIGLQTVLLWVYAKIFAIREGLLPPDQHFQALTGAFALEFGLIIGAVLLAAGVALGLYAVAAWGAHQFGDLSPDAEMRIVIPSGTAISLAFEILYGSFFVGVLEIPTSRYPQTAVNGALASSFPSTEAAE
jgi:hypothetical protein